MPYALRSSRWYHPPPQRPPQLLDLSISSSGRYLQLPDGTPFPLFIESGWEHSRMTAPNWQTYLNALSSRGYTSVLNQGALNPELDATDDYGNPYFNATVSPGVYDITQPNSAAFANARAAILYAQSLGIVSFFFPAYIGFVGTNEGLQTAVQAATGAQCEAYGVFIGNLIKDIPGVIISLGGDQIPDATDIEKYRRITVGIKSVDRAGRIYTWHAARTQSSYDLDNVTPGYVASLGVPFMDWAYAREVATLAMCHYQCLTSYAVPHTVFMGEAYYENSSQANSDPVMLRRQFWGSWLSGALGAAFGDIQRYEFQSGWESTLSRPGLADDVVNIAAMKSRQWWKLVPSRGTGLVTAGGGTENTLTYKPRALASDGSWGAVHTPDGTTFTVNMSLFSGAVTCRWMNANGSLVAASGGPVFPNSGTRSFVASSEVGNNSRGQADWVLFLEVLP